MEEIMRSYIFDLAKNANCDRLSVGAALVDSEDVLIGSGYNRNPMGSNHDCDRHGHVYRYIENRQSCRRTTHAEVAAIHDAISKGNYDKLREATLYVTHTPCSDCMKFITEFGIRKVKFFEKYGEIDSLFSDIVSVEEIE